MNNMNVLIDDLKSLIDKANDILLEQPSIFESGGNHEYAEVAKAEIEFEQFFCQAIVLSRSIRDALQLQEDSAFDRCIELMYSDQHDPEDIIAVLNEEIGIFRYKSLS